MDPYDAFDELAGGGFGGDDPRARELFDCAEPLIRGVVRRICARQARWRAHLEDIIQECLSEVWQSRKRFLGKHPGQLWEFIKKIAFYTSLKKPPKSLPPLPDGDDNSEKRRPQADPRPLLGGEEVEALELCLAKLRHDKLDWYNAVVLVDLSGLPEEEAARVLGVNPKTLRDRKLQGRRWLCQCLAQRGIDHYP